jgi:hypothetical protein
LEARHFGLETAAAIAIAAAAASAAAGATGAIVQSRQASATARFNQDISEQQAELARRAGSAAEADTREQSARIMALQRAQLGDSGITGEGTPLLLLLDSAQQAEVEAGRARYTGQVNEQAAEASANLYRTRGAQARAGGVIGAGTSLLTGAASAGSAYSRGRRNPTLDGSPSGY